MQSHLLAGDTGTDKSTDQGSTNDNNNASGAIGVPNSKTVQNKFRDAVAAAVYVDKRRSEDRANTFVVRGIAESANHNDRDTVYELCANEFNIDLDIVASKRLGRDTQPGRSRPLLVVCRSVNAAADVIASAKRLRRSADPVTKKNVFINPNLI